MSNPKHRLYLIGAGLPRTGTMSMQVALERILPGHCMHFMTVIRGNIKEAMDDVFDEHQSTDKSFKSFFERNNIVAGVDVPFIFQYKQAMKLYPDAKVVLTIREPSVWVRSMEKTVFRIYKKQSPLERFLGGFIGCLFPIMRKFDRFMRNAPIFKGALQSIAEGTGEEFYTNWVEDVKKNVPPERLLIFSVKEGWEPLCNFLNLPIPDEPFPHVNDADQFNKRHKFFKCLAIGLFSSSVIMSLFIGYNIVKYFNYDINSKIQDFINAAFLQ